MAAHGFNDHLWHDILLERPQDKKQPLDKISKILELKDHWSNQLRELSEKNRPVHGELIK